jgi:hypothetical protein
MFEVSAALEKLKAKLLARKYNKFIPNVRTLLQALEKHRLINLS